MKMYFAAQKAPTLNRKHSTNSFSLQPKLIKSSVTSAAIADVLDKQRATSHITFAMNGPNHSKVHRWFHPKHWVNDSCSSQIIAQFCACNVGLGNRGPAQNGKFCKLCAQCATTGVTALNNELNPCCKKIKM